eukprot:5264024-Pyramimonas_sp.AAC.1
MRRGPGMRSVLSQTNHWEHRDNHKNGVMEMWQALQGGFESMHYVRVNNLTLSGEVGEWRSEWFMNYFPSDPTREVSVKALELRA